MDSKTFNYKFQKPIQKPNQHRRGSSKLSRIANVWALSCALDLGLLRESSLKEVVFASYSQLNSLSITEDAAKSHDLDANEPEDDASKSANIFGNSWPFIDPAQIKQIECTKRVRRRRRKTRWSVRRQRKPRDPRPRLDSATSDLSKRSTSSSVRGSGRVNLGVSRDRSARLSVRKNPSSTRSRVFVGTEDERLSESYRSTGDEEEEVISQTTSETSSEEIAPVDYSGSGYSRFYSTSHPKEEEPQNRTELSEYPDYFMNVLRIDNSTENNDLDTSEDDTSRNNVQTAKFAKSTKRQASRKILENGKAPRRARKASLRKEKSEKLENSGNHIKMPEEKKKRRRRTVGQKKTHNSAMYNHYNHRRISHDLEENSPKSKSDSRVDVAAGTRDAAEEIAVQKCRDCKAPRRSRDFTNAACPCKRDSKNIAAALMREIQECINTKNEMDVENIEKSISEIEKSMSEELSSKDLMEISMEYDWIDNDDWNLSFRTLERLFDSNAEESSLSVNTAGRRRKKRHRYSINCKFDESTETAYRSVFHDCVDFDTPRSTPSLKINMEESWRSAEDSSDNDDEIHSSWRRSTLGSSTEECGNEVDGALLLARKIVSSDDATKDEKCDDEHENNTCYKYQEMSDSFTVVQTNSYDDSDEDKEFANQRDETSNMITYRNKNRTIRRWGSSGSIKDEDEDFKVSELLLMYSLIELRLIC